VLTLPGSVRIYLAVDPVDLRRGHDGLSAIVQGQWGVDLFEGHLFVFFGRRRDRCKILFWDRGGLWLILFVVAIVVVVVSMVANVLKKKTPPEKASKPD